MLTQKRNGSTYRWRQLRARVLRASDVCWLCGEPGADSVDHVTPLSLGGDRYAVDNLRPAHLLCNKQRGNGATPGTPVVPSSREW